jgi:hypothetical protein
MMYWHPILSWPLSSSRLLLVITLFISALCPFLSIIIQAAFGLLELLGGAAVPREDQKAMCPKHSTDWDESCHNKFRDVQFTYLFFQSMDGYNYSSRGGFPFIQPNALPSYTVLPETPAVLFSSAKEINDFDGDDNCVGKSVRHCLKTFFENSTEHDVLIFNVGHAFALSKYPSATVDLISWARSAASSFRSHITATFKGRVFHQNMPHLKDKLARQNPTVQEFNRLLYELWRPGSEDLASNEMWYHIDQWAINSDHSNQYSDHVHFPGPLNDAMLYQVLNTVCPRPITAETSVMTPPPPTVASV